MPRPGVSTGQMQGIFSSTYDAAAAATSGHASLSSCQDRPQVDVSICPLPLALWVVLRVSVWRLSPTSSIPPFLPSGPAGAAKTAHTAPSPARTQLDSRLQS